MAPEKRLEEEIITELHKRGWWAHHFDAVGVDGWPDILAIRGTEFRLIEVKAGTALRNTQRGLHAFFQQTYKIHVHVIERRKHAALHDGEVYGVLHDAVSEVIR